MSTAIEKLKAAQLRAMAGRPKVGGFPYLAETLRRAGVTRNLWYLPACQSLYLTEDGPVVSIGTPLVSGTADSTVRHLSPRCEPTKPGEARFQNFWRRHGVLELFATMSISSRAHALTMERAVTNTSKVIRQSMWGSLRSFPKEESPSF